MKEKIQAFRSDLSPFAKVTFKYLKEISIALN